MREDWPDDELLSVRLWDSSVQTLVALLRGLAQITEPGRERLPAEIRSYLLQAMDSGADLDIACDGFADELERARREVAVIAAVLSADHAAPPATGVCMLAHSACVATDELRGRLVGALLEVVGRSSAEEQASQTTTGSATSPPALETEQIDDVAERPGAPRRMPRRSSARRNAGLRGDPAAVRTYSEYRRRGPRKESHRRIQCGITPALKKRLLEERITRCDRRDRTDLRGPCSLEVRGRRPCDRCAPSPRGELTTSATGSSTAAVRQPGSLAETRRPISARDLCVSNAPSWSVALPAVRTCRRHPRSEGSKGVEARRCNAAKPTAAAPLPRRVTSVTHTRCTVLAPGGRPELWCRRAPPRGRGGSARPPHSCRPRRGATHKLRLLGNPPCAVRTVPLAPDPPAKKPSNVQLSGLTKFCRATVLGGEEQDPRVTAVPAADAYVSDRARNGSGRPVKPIWRPRRHHACLALRSELRYEVKPCGHSHHQFPGASQVCAGAIAVVVRREDDVMVEENGIRRTGCTPREDLRPPLLDEETRSAGERWLLGALKSLVTDLGGLVEAFADDDRLYRVWRGSAKAFVLLQEPTEQTVELFCSTDPTGTLVGAIAAERSGRSARQPDGPVEEFARIVVTVDRHRQALEPPRQ